MNSIVHITPQLPPAIDGVGDYCANLWKHWPDAQPEWSFLVTRGAAETRHLFPNAEVREFALNGEALTAALEQTGNKVAMLHYVGYAYQPKGMPVWLPEALQRWKNADPRRRLVTMFHEMYARSSPLRSPFWVAPFARKIIGELVKLSDTWVTNCDRYFNQLVTEFSARAELGRMLPIGSNIPLVSTSTRPVDANSKFRVVVFGLAKTRLWALERHWRFLRAMNEAGILDSVTLLGKSSEPNDDRALQNFIDKAGHAAQWLKRFDLSAEEISCELGRHHLGLLANEPDILTKSGVFAALATHGVIPVLSAAPQAALPSFTVDAVFANDETAQTSAALLGALRDPIRLQDKRTHLVAAAEHLAWPRITQRWHGVLQKISQSRPLRADSVKLPILTGA